MPRPIVAAIAFSALLWVAIAHADDTTDPATAKRLADAQAAKAEWDAKKAKLDYENAAAPASAQTGKVDVKANAGQIEADVLMAQSLKPIAETIVVAVKTIAAGKHIALFTGTDAQTLVRWEMFHFRTDHIAESIKTLSARKDDLDKRYSALSQASAHNNLKVLAFIPAIAALSSVSKLLSYTMTDYEVGGITVSTDDGLLVAAIAAQPDGLQFYLPTRLMKADAGNDIYKIISELDKSNLDVQSWAALGKARSTELQGLAKQDKPRAAELNALAKDYDTLVGDCGNAIAAHDSLMTTLASTDDKNPMPLSAVVQEKGISDAMGADGFGLFVHMHSAAGGYFTKKNLWTYFGGMPFYVSGGAVVSYTLIGRADGRVAAAGVVPFECGYRKASKVASDTPKTDCRVK